MRSLNFVAKLITIMAAYVVIDPSSSAEDCHRDLFFGDSVVRAITMGYCRLLYPEYFFTPLSFSYLPIITEFANCYSKFACTVYVKKKH